MSTGDQVLCFPLRKGNIFLGRRERPPWLGKLSGFGGKIKEGETPEEAQVREFFEETGARIREKDLILVGMILLCLNGEEKTLYVYIVKRWKETISDTEEMHRHEFPIKSIPFERMIEGDARWLQWVLKGYYFEACLVRGEDLNKLRSFEFLNLSFEGFL